MQHGIFDAPAGLLEPKPKPVDDIDASPLDYACRISGPSSAGKEIVTVEEDIPLDLIFLMESKGISSRYSSHFLDVLTSYCRDVVNAYSEEGGVMYFDEFSAFIDVILDNAVDVVLDEMSADVARSFANEM